MAGRDDYFKAAYNQLQLISQDENKRMEYEARQKTIRDYNEGMLESHERGLKQGRAEGERKRLFDIAKKLLSMGLDLDMISKSLSQNKGKRCIIASG